MYSYALNTSCGFKWAIVQVGDCIVVLGFWPSLKTCYSLYEQADAKELFSWKVNKPLLYILTLIY